MRSQAAEDERSMRLVRAETAAEICGQLELDAEAKEHLQEGQSPKEYFDLLLEHGLLADALRFLAHALPKREAVWWACLCLRSTLDGEVEPEEVAPLEAGEAWVMSQSEESRQRAMQAAEATEYATAAGWAAAGAAWSGGSLAEPDLDEVPPGETLTAKAVTAAVMLAAAAGEAEQVEPRQRRFAQIGLTVADGGSRWREEDRAARKEEP